MSSKSDGLGTIGPHEPVDVKAVVGSRTCRTPGCERDAERKIDVHEDGWHFAVSVCKPCQISHSTGKRYERYREQ